MSHEIKNTKATVYVLWAFLGLFGFHRFYFEQYRSGIVLLLLTIIGFPLHVAFPDQPNFGFALLWWLGDFFYVTYKLNTPDKEQEHEKNKNAALTVPAN